MDAGQPVITAGGALTVHDLWRWDPATGPVRPSTDQRPDVLDVGVLPGGSRAFVSTFRQRYDSGLHRTATVDVSTVLAGSVCFRTETAEIDLHTGDSVVVAGVLHGWYADEAGCQLLVVMFGVAPDR